MSRTVFDLFYIFCPNMSEEGFLTPPPDRKASEADFKSFLHRQGILERTSFVTSKFLPGDARKFFDERGYLTSSIDKDGEEDDFYLLFDNCVFAGYEVKYTRGATFVEGTEFELVAGSGFKNVLGDPISAHDFMEEQLRLRERYGNPKTLTESSPSSQKTLYDVFCAFYPGSQPPEGPALSSMERVVSSLGFEILGTSKQEGYDEEDVEVAADIKILAEDLEKKGYLLHFPNKLHFYILFEGGIYTFVRDKPHRVSFYLPTTSQFLDSISLGGEVHLSSHEYLELLQRYSKVYGRPIFESSLPIQKTYLDLFALYLPELAGKSLSPVSVRYPRSDKDYPNLEHLGNYFSDLVDDRFFKDEDRVILAIDEKEFHEKLTSLGVICTPISKDFRSLENFVFLWRGSMFSASWSRIEGVKSDDKKYKLTRIETVLGQIYPEYRPWNIQLSAHDFLELSLDAKRFYDPPPSHLEESATGNKTLLDLFKLYIPSFEPDDHGMHPAYPNAEEDFESLSKRFSKFGEVTGKPGSLKFLKLGLSPSEFHERLSSMGVILTSLPHSKFSFLWGSTVFDCSFDFDNGGGSSVHRAFGYIYPNSPPWSDTLSAHEFLEKSIEARKVYGPPPSSPIGEFINFKPTWASLFEVLSPGIFEQRDFGPEVEKTADMISKRLSSRGLECFVVRRQFREFTEVLVSKCRANLLRELMLSFGYLGTPSVDGMSYFLVDGGIWHTFDNLSDDSGVFHYTNPLKMKEDLDIPMSAHEYLEKAKYFGGPK